MFYGNRHFVDCLYEKSTAVVLAMVAGTALGVVRRIGQKIEWACGGMQKMLNPNAEENGLLVTAMVLFCASGTGIYGAVVSGVSGDHAILLSKAILDFCTAMIFACTLGRITAMIAAPAIRDSDGCFYDCEGIGHGNR